MFYGLFHRSGNPITKEVKGNSVTREMTRMNVVFSSRRDAYLWRDENEPDAVIKPVGVQGYTCNFILIRNNNVPQRINAIKCLRSLMGLNLKDAKALLDVVERDNSYTRLPVTMITANEASQFVKDMDEFGYNVISDLPLAQSAIYKEHG